LKKPLLIDYCYRDISLTNTKRQIPACTRKEQERKSKISLLLLELERTGKRGQDKGSKKEREKKKAQSSYWREVGY
jgi:hypothetical protein